MDQRGLNTYARPRELQHTYPYDDRLPTRAPMLGLCCFKHVPQLCRSQRPLDTTGGSGNFWESCSPLLVHMWMRHGYGSKLNHKGSTGFSPWFHLPGLDLGPIADPQPCENSLI